MKFKLKAKTRKAIQGSISVLMVIILLPMMTFSAVIVDTSRINMAKQMMSSAGDLTMNTALANYDTILKDVYGLFAMSQDKTQAQLAADLQEYFEETVAGYGIVSKAEAGEYVQKLMGSFDVLLADAEGYTGEQVSNFLKLENVVVKEADRVNGSALSNSSILRNQIVEYMKFRAPLNFGMSFIDALKSFEVADEQMDVVETQVKAQEGTQDVTTACAALIKLIREYDDLVKDINSGSKVVTGLNKTTDGTAIPIVDYDTHVAKYLSTMDEDYTHINKLMMVFLAKAPSVSDVYLIKQNYAGGVYFIKADSSDVVYENSGINQNPSLSGDKDGAKNQVNAQISTVNGLKNVAIAYAGPEFNKYFIDQSLINSDKSAFTDETKAINNFIAYENFIKNKSTTVTYDQVKNLLDQIYILAKYYDNYDGKVTSAINTAKANWETANGVLEGINNTINNTGSTLQGYVNTINTTSASVTNVEKTLANAGSYKTSAKNLLSKTLPTVSGNYDTYYNNNMKASYNHDVYRDMYYSIANSLKNSKTSAEKAVATKALEYLSNSQGMTLASYFDSKLNAAQKLTTGNLRNIFIALLTNSDATKGYETALTNYNTAVSQKPTAEANVQSTKAVYDGLVQEKSNMNTAYTGCLSGYQKFVQVYQADAYHYGTYITTATNIVNRETKAVADQFGKICSNISELTKKLEAIKNQAATVNTQIVEYRKKLDTWEAENNAYIQANGSDSFSKQTAADIATARSNYNLDSLVTLQQFISNDKKTGLYDRFNDFNTYLQSDVYFKYGGKRLHEIKSAADAKTAAKSNIDSITAEIITVEQATTSLGQLYKGDTGLTFVPYAMQMEGSDQLCFLEDKVIQITFLKYLNSAYPETANKNTTNKDGETVNAEDEYNKQKEDLKKPKESIDDMGKEEEPKTEEKDSGKDKDKNKDKDKDKDKDKKEEEKPKTDKYGYSYKNVTLTEADKTDRPSANKTTSADPSNSAFALDDSGKASDSVGKQGSALDSILSGLGSAVTAGIENAYILTYLMENFSYATMIQDVVVEAEGSKKDSLSITEAKDLMTAETLKKYVDEQKSLSGVKKRAPNNYLYGGELEYLVYGNTDPSKNVGFMKASIYGIRFCFNCIYAFTNSEIRNTTMTAGLAVQAATMGIVPYQVVQIVLQLALAAAESAVDLNMMMTGLDVAVVKTKETWMLSVSSAVKTVGDFVGEKAANVADKTIRAVTGSLQNVVDVSADKLSGAIAGVKNDLQKSTEQAIQDTIDSAFGVVTNEIEKVLNQLQFEELKTQTEVTNWVNTNIDAAQNTIETELNTRFGTSDIGKKVVKFIKDKGYITNIANAVKNKVADAVKLAPTPSQAVEKVMDQIIAIKTEIINEATKGVEGMLNEVQGIADEALASVKTELDGYIGQAGKDLSESASKTIRDSVTNATNNFVDGTLSKIDTTVDGGSGGSSVASLIKFGYKEYLMLFLYIGICAGGTSENNKILLRTADLIQFNICHATKGKSAFYHNKADKFRMKNACTYVSIEVEADLDMFFMDMDLFASMVEEEETLPGENGATVEKTDTGTKIKYKGLLGY